jgi:hypothetical protein
MHLSFRDTNSEVVDAIRRFSRDLVDTGRVAVTLGDIFDDVAADAVVSPANTSRL